MPMIFAMSLIIAGIISSAQQAVARESPCSFPIRVSPQGHIFVTVTVDDSLSADLILDTGAGLHCLSKQIFDMVHVHTDSIGRYTAFRATGDRLDVGLYQLSSLSIGTFREENPIVTYWSLLDSAQVDGILSAKFLEHHIVTLDLRENYLIFEDQLTLSDRLRNGHMLPLKVNQDRDKSLDLFIDVQFGDARVLECILDTGGATRFDSAFMSLVPIENLSEWERINETGMKEVIFSGNIPYIALAHDPSIRQDKPHVSFLPNLIYDGQIGAGFLMGRVVTFNVPDKYLVVQND